MASAMSEYAATADSVHTSGSATVRGFVDATMVATCRRELRRLASEPIPSHAMLAPSPGSRAPSARKIADVARRSAALSQLAASPALLRLVGDVLQTTEVRLLQSTAWMKPAGVGTPKPPHQDAAHWLHIAPLDFVTAWVALDSADESNGCLYFSPTPWDGPLYRHERVFDHVETGDLTIPGWDVASGEPAVLAVGDASIHGGRTVHWSGPNDSGRQRRGVAFSYCRGDATSRAGLDLGSLPFYSVAG